jgi:hypothetical protein
LFSNFVLHNSASKSRGLPARTYDPRAMTMFHKRAPIARRTQLKNDLGLDMQLFVM